MGETEKTKAVTEREVLTCLDTHTWRSGSEVRVLVVKGRNERLDETDIANAEVYLILEILVEQTLLERRVNTESKNRVEYRRTVGGERTPRKGFWSAIGDILRPSSSPVPA